MSGEFTQPSPNGTVLTNIPYTDDTSDPDRQLDLHIVTNHASTTQPPPLLVYIHGGLWMDRDKREYTHIARHYTKHNLSVALLNYRRTSHPPASTPPADTATQHPAAPEDMSLVIRHPTHTFDVAAALTFLTSPTASHHHIPHSAYDRTRVIVFGHSCGAHMAALLTTHPHRFHVPPTTLRSIVGAVGSEGIYSVAQYAAAHPDWSADLYRVFPAFDDPVVPQDAQEAQEHNPPLPATARAPWLVLHSRDDAWVERAQAEVWVEWLTGARCEVRLVDVSGGHFEVVERIGGTDDVISPLLLPWIEQLLLKHRNIIQDS